MEYTKRWGDTVVCFSQGFVNPDGSPRETRLNKKNCLDVIESIEAERDSYVTQEAYNGRLKVYIDAARFMGWL